jgi:hypothetical protein
VRKRSRHSKKVIPASIVSRYLPANLIVVLLAPAAAKQKHEIIMMNYLNRHKRFGIILLGIIGLNFAYGYDPRFTIINLLWIFISIVKLD